MGKIVATEFISLDGVIEDPGGSEDFVHGAWTFEFDRGDEGNKFKLDEVMDAEAQLLGRVTYEGFADAWPSRAGDEFADKLNSMPKYVVSSTLTEPGWENTTVLSGDAVEEVQALKDRPGGDIVLTGSITLAHTMIEAGLVDEYRLFIYPSVQGRGRRLFPDGLRIPELQLTGARSFRSGITLATYAVEQSG
jgi:dihydrofolate reductase